MQMVRVSLIIIVGVVLFIYDLKCRKKDVEKFIKSCPNPDLARYIIENKIIREQQLQEYLKKDHLDIDHLSKVN